MEYLSFFMMFERALDIEVETYIYISQLFIDTPRLSIDIQHYACKKSNIS